MCVHHRDLLTPDDNTVAKSTSRHRITLIIIPIQYKINDNSNNICARCSLTDHNRDGRENPFESVPPHTPLLYVLFNGRL